MVKMDILAMGLGLMLFILALAILILVLYIKTLIRQAKRKEWGWFVVSLLISPAWIIYWIVKWVK